MFALRQPLDQITKLTRAMPLGKIFLRPRADCLRKRPAIGAQLRETRIDLLQMFFAKLGHFEARFATVILQIQDLFCFLERQAQRLRLLNKSDTPDRFRRIESIIGRGALRFRQQSESLIIMQRLHANSGRLGNRAHLQRLLIIHDHDGLLCDYTVEPWLRPDYFTLATKLCCPWPCGPSKEIFALQSPDMSILILARYRPGVFVRSIVLPECICIPGMFISMSNLTLPTSTS